MNVFHKMSACIILVMIFGQSLTGCPTCIGRLHMQSPAFFSDELYQLDAEDDVEELKPAGNAEKKNASEDDEDD